MNPRPEPARPDTEAVPKPRDPPEKARERRHALHAGLFGLVLPPLLLLLQIGVNYALVPWTCAGGPVLVLHLVALAVLLGAAGGVLASWRAWTALGRGGLTEAAGTREGGRFIALAGLLSAAWSGLAIVGVALPAMIVGPCD
jgi:hypothetical protein